jgi:hypothetical protein
MTQIFDQLIFASNGGKGIFGNSATNGGRIAS